MINEEEQWVPVELVTESVRFDEREDGSWEMTIVLDGVSEEEGEIPYVQIDNVDLHALTVVGEISE